MTPPPSEAIAWETSFPPAGDSVSADAAAASAEYPPEAGAARVWRPRRVLITPDALRHPHGEAMLERAAGYGAEVVRLKGNRLPSFTVRDASKPVGADGKSPVDERRSYAQAKTTLAIVTAPPSARKLQPIPPSADWQFHLAQGCPAHCQYCYLAGSLQGPPVTRAYANLDEILSGLTPYLGQGTVTSRSVDRASEGTTFEASCYTDPLGIEHLTGSLAAAIEHFGRWTLMPGQQVQLRFTTKFSAVDSLLALAHNGRTRIRFSVNAESIGRDFEGGTSPVRARLAAMRKVAEAGYPVGLTIAPIMPVAGWREQYTELLTAAAEALRGIASPDLTAELITHRFTPGSKDVLLSWYPKTTLDLLEANRTQKRTKFGTFKYVYPKDPMAELRAFFYGEIPRILPSCRILYWT